MKHRLINTQTKQEHLCDKVVIDGFDYYVSDEQATEGLYGYINFQGGEIKKIRKYFADDWKLVIATNNSSIDIPQVRDEVEVMRETLVETYLEKIKDLTKRFFWKAGFKHGYNKSQETHPFSEEDLIEFADWKDKNIQELNYSMLHNTKELLQLWKKQKPKIVYYE